MVLFVADFFHPVGGLAVEVFLNGDVGHVSESLLCLALLSDRFVARCLWDTDPPGP